MKSILVKKEDEKKEIEYPCLMISSDNIGLTVLMTEDGVGTVVTTDNSFDIGYYFTDWDMASFTPLADEDQVILSNGK